MAKDHFGLTKSQFDNRIQNLRTAQKFLQQGKLPLGEPRRAMQEAAAFFLEVSMRAYEVAEEQNSLELAVLCERHAADLLSAMTADTPSLRKRMAKSVGSVINHMQDPDWPAHA